MLFFQDPAGIFELVEVVGNGTYGQVYKVSTHLVCVTCVSAYSFCACVRLKLRKYM